MSEGIGKVEFVFSETKAQQSEAKVKENSNLVDGNKGANVRDSRLRLRYKPSVSDLCFHLDNTVSLLQCFTGPGVWQ